MSTTAWVINALGTDEVTAEVYSSISDAAKLASIVRDRAQRMRLIYALRKANRSLARLLDDINDAFAGNAPEAGHSEATPQSIHRTVDNLSHLFQMIDYVYECSRRAGLTNSALTAGSLRKLQVHGEAVKDLIDWFEVAEKPDEINAIFERAKQERERGEVFDLPLVD